MTKTCENAFLHKKTGLVASSVKYDVNGRQTTEYTVKQFRTYIDGHYAHLVSSVSKVYSDPPIISATPGKKKSLFEKEKWKWRQECFQKINFFFFCPVYDPFGVHSRTPKILPAKPKESGTIPTSVVGNR